MSDDLPDYYAILGVSPRATGAQIKRAYRRLAKRLHPDVNQMPDAAERFKQVNEAYQILSSSRRRADYDRRREPPPPPPDEVEEQPDEPPIRVRRSSEAEPETTFEFYTRTLVRFTQRRVTWVLAILQVSSVVALRSREAPFLTHQVWAALIFSSLLILMFAFFLEIDESRRGRRDLPEPYKRRVLVSIGFASYLFTVLVGIPVGLILLDRYVPGLCALAPIWLVIALGSWLMMPLLPIRDDPV